MLKTIFLLILFCSFSRSLLAKLSSLEQSSNTLNQYQIDWASYVNHIEEKRQKALKKIGDRTQIDQDKPKQNYGLLNPRPKKEDPVEDPTKDMVASLGPLLQGLGEALGGLGQCGDPNGIGTNGGESSFGCYGSDPDVSKMIEVAKSNATTCSPNSHNSSVCSCSGDTCTKAAQDSAAWCARHVSDALCHHSYDGKNSEKPDECNNKLVSSRTNANGKEMDGELAQQGFVDLLKLYPQMNPKNAPIGAIYVYGGQGEGAAAQYGHVDIKTGENEHVSDFVQNGSSKMVPKAIMVKKDIFEKCANSLMPKENEVASR